MWDPITYIPRERGYIYAEFGHYYVMRDDGLASNWRALEAEAQQVVSSHQWGGDHSSCYPLTWDLLEKADFIPREQDKAQETYIVGDGGGRFFVRHLEYGKPVDQWREVEVYITHFIEEDRYRVENKDGIALNWEELEAEARAAVAQMGEEFQDRYVLECPPGLAEKAEFAPVEEIDLEHFAWEDDEAFLQRSYEASVLSQTMRTDNVYDLDFGR
jgi:hypothetical protein